jgi:CheY-like chemotaxis protein
MSTMDRLRLLVVSPLAGYVAAQIANTFETSRVDTVTKPDQLVAAVRRKPRYDAAMIDLTWNDPDHEWSFDGLDALELLREEDRVTASIVAAQGHSFEDDHLQEATDQQRFPEVIAAIQKPDGMAAITMAIGAAVTGARLPSAPFRHPKPALHHYFSRGRGRTAARMAAAVASGRAARYETLATIAQVAPETANKLVSYLAPIIKARGEVPPHEPLTQPAVYRWCGEHARYLLSWERRNIPPGHCLIERWTS